jgi:hypothetical protein
MKDPRSYLGLHTVSMLREVIRKWWQVDIGLADAAGRLSDHSWGGPEPVPPAGNDFCRQMLNSKAGRRRCLSSVREIHRLLRPGTRTRGRLVHSCHLGLQMAAAPVYARGRYRGFVFACGFSSRELSRTRITRLRGAVLDILSDKEALSGERVPILGREDIERLKDLLAYGAGEMGAFEDELARREAASHHETRVSFEGIVQRSPNMAEVLSRLKKVSHASAPILLVGEPGSGKRVLARAVALSGPRRISPFVVFEGSPDALAAESKLFGQVRGGPLGKIGVLESAAHAAGKTVAAAPGGNPGAGGIRPPGGGRRSPALRTPAGSRSRGGRGKLAPRSGRVADALPGGHPPAERTPGGRRPPLRHVH